MIPLVTTQDNIGRTMIGTRQPGFTDFVKLTADTGVTLVVPTNANHALFSCSADFYVQYTTDALTSAVYAASNADLDSATRTSSGIEMNPQLRSLVDVSGIGVISASAGTMTISWFG